MQYVRTLLRQTSRSLRSLSIFRHSSGLMFAEPVETLAFDDIHDVGMQLSFPHLQTFVSEIQRGDLLLGLVVGPPIRLYCIQSVLLGDHNLGIFLPSVLSRVYTPLMSATHRTLQVTPARSVAHFLFPALEILVLSEYSCLLPHIRAPNLGSFTLRSVSAKTARFKPKHQATASNEIWKFIGTHSPSLTSLHIFEPLSPIHDKSSGLVPYTFFHRVNFPVLSNATFCMNDYIGAVAQAPSLHTLDLRPPTRADPTLLSIDPQAVIGFASVKSLVLDPTNFLMHGLLNKFQQLEGIHLCLDTQFGDHEAEKQLLIALGKPYPLIISGSTPSWPCPGLRVLEICLTEYAELFGDISLRMEEDMEEDRGDRDSDADSGSQWSTSNEGSTDEDDDLETNNVGDKKVGMNKQKKKKPVLLNVCATTQQTKAKTRTKKMMRI